jgi:hypothetical protein
MMFFDYNGSSDDWEADKVNGYFNISRLRTRIHYVFFSLLVKNFGSIIHEQII